jgi:choice-of-anchor C domain-containing protein
MWIVSKMSSAARSNADGWGLLKQDDNHFWFGFGGGDTNGLGSDAPTTIRSTTSVVPGVWYHVVAVKTAAHFSLYVNGIEEASKPLPSFKDTNTSDLLLGATDYGSHMAGLIDEVTVYSRALSPAEVKARWSSLAPATKPVAERVGEVRRFVTGEKLAPASEAQILLEADRERGQNLLVNGSFEEGPDTPNDGIHNIPDLDQGSTAIKGWVVTRPVSIPIDSAYWRPAHGKRSLTINRLGGGISQSFKTKNGQKYRVSFWLAGDPHGGPKERKLQISAAGKNAEFVFDMAGKNRADMGWLGKSWEFTAEADQTTLEFSSLTDGIYGVAIDDVIVVAEKSVPPAEKVGEARRLVGHTEQPWAAAFLPDGKRVLSAGFDKVLRLWDMETGRELDHFGGHSDGILAVAVSPDGRMAMSGGGGLGYMPNSARHEEPGKDFTVRLWDLDSHREVRRFEGHSHIVWCLAFSPDGRFALSGSMDHSMRLWNVANGKEVRRFPHDARVMGVCFSPDGKWGLSSTGGEDIVLWDLETGRDLRHFQGESGKGVAFSPDGRYILSGGYETLRVWDLQSGKEVRRFDNNSGMSVVHLAISPDGRRALTGGNRKSSGGGTERIMSLWDFETGKELGRYYRVRAKGNLECVAFSPDGRTALSVSDNDLAISLWSLPDAPPAKENP